MTARLPGTPYMEFLKLFKKTPYKEVTVMIKKVVAGVLIFAMLAFISVGVCYAKGRKADNLSGPQRRNSVKTVYDLPSTISQDSSTVTAVPAYYGTWLWNAWMIVNDAQKVLDFLKNNSFYELYLQIDKTINPVYYANFISMANSYGISVYALDGNPYWVFEDKNASLYEFLNWVQSYNSQVMKNARFKGIHLDVEPYDTPEWSQNRDLVVKKYQDFVVSTLEKAHSMGLGLYLDIPYWFDEITFNNIYGEGNLAQWVIGKVDGVNIMAYKDRAQDIIDISKNEVLFAKSAGKRIVISVETQSLPQNDVTFYEEGLAFMYTELEKVRNYFYGLGYDNIGFAVHHLASIIGY